MPLWPTRRRPVEQGRLVEPRLVEPRPKVVIQSDCSVVCVTCLQEGDVIVEAGLKFINALTCDRCGAV